jgi:hypothetical protein
MCLESFIRPGGKFGFIHKLEKRQRFWKGSLMVRMITGWKPILLYPRRVRGDGSRMTLSLARRSGEQCSIGFQPVFITLAGRFQPLGIIDKLEKRQIFGIRRLCCE